MLQRYKCVTEDDYTNALKEIIQEVALLGLWRAKFFEHAAFYGGTALRILYRLNRFSEDLDFSLLKKNRQFSFLPYKHAIEAELGAFGFQFTMTEKKKSPQATIESAFLKGNTKEHLIQVEAPKTVQERCHADSLIKIKMELDIHPPPKFQTETLSIILENAVENDL